MTTQRTYKIIAGSTAERFHASRAKIRLTGGGFGSGKSTALIAEVLKIAVDYPGSTLLVARATFPKLNSTVRREFFNWCPPSWIKSWNKTDNTVVLHNDTTIDFRYIAQRDAGAGESTSNLLSANYSAVFVDQIEDAEITESDFEQLLGRLRDNTPYAGTDITMPRTGPRMMVLTCNPTLGWVYKRLVKPYHNYLAGKLDYDLICVMDEYGMPVLDADGKQQPLIEVFESSTYDNAQNLAPDYIQTLEATYRGKMRQRYLLGKWVAFEGVVYDEYDEDVHVIPHQYMLDHVQSIRMNGYEMVPIEAYDFGITAPSCYLFGVTDPDGAVYLLDGYYEREMGVTEQAAKITEIRTRYGVGYVRPEDMHLFADPQVAKRTNAANSGIGLSVQEMFRRQGIHMRLASNDKMPGIMRVKEMLEPRTTVINPFTTAYGAPMLYVADTLTFLRDEITTYRWKKGVHDDVPTDKPVEVNDHAMDALRYMLSGDVPRPKRVRTTPRPLTQRVRKWHEQDIAMRDARGHRYSA